MVHALRLEPIAVLARALDNPALNGLLEDMRTRTGNAVIYRQGTIRRVMRALQAGEGVGGPHRPAHSDAATRFRRFFQAPRRDHRRSRRARAAHRRRVVPLFALPLAGGRYRMIYEHAGRAAAMPAARMPSRNSPSAAPTCSRCTSAGIRSCGCGCTGAGVRTRSWRRRRGFGDAGDVAGFLGPGWRRIENDANRSRSANQATNQDRVGLRSACASRSRMRDRSPSAPAPPASA